MSAHRLGERYRLGRPLGAGGMGAVFEATDLSTGEQRAVKVLHGWRGSPDHIVRFKREFRAAARLGHPHCLPVYELDRSVSGEWFYTMELAVGGHLDTRKAWAWQAVAQMGLQILAALDHIHGKRIVHRDIKPGNILIHQQDAGSGLGPLVKVADFGISKVSDLDEGNVGAVLGSLAYLAPEQLEGRADPRSDLYSLGVVMYEAIAGRHPFALASASAAAAPGTTAVFTRYGRQERPLVPLAQMNGEVPGAVSELVMHLLQEKLEDRPATSAVVFDALSRTLADLLGPGRPRWSPPITRAPYLAPATLVGRSAERERMRRFVASVAAGLQTDEAVVLFVEGPAGAGKSRLMGELVGETGRRGVRLESGSWRDGGSAWPLRSLMSALSIEPAADTPGAPATAAAPALLTLDQTQTAVAGLGPADAQPWPKYHQIAEGLLALARRQSILLLLEDAHWADPTSLELLGFLIRRVAQSREAGTRVRVGFVITRRPTAAGAEFLALERIADAHGAAAAIHLSALGPQETLAVVCSMLISPPTAPIEELARRLHESSQGNPLLIGQTLHLLLAEGRLTRPEDAWVFEPGGEGITTLPSSLKHAVGDRAAKLSLGTKRLLAAAAVIGRQVEFALLERVARMDPLVLLDCLDEALRAEFLLEHPSRPSVHQFVHDRVRDAIVERLGDRERNELHRRTAEILRQQSRKDPSLAADLAHHLRAAGAWDEAEDAYTEAAQQAAGGHAFARAADLFAEALGCARQRGVAAPSELVEQHADACLQSGRYDAALASYAERIAAVGPGDHRFQLMRKAAEAEWRRGNTAASGEQFETILRVSGHRVPAGRWACMVGLGWGVAGAIAGRGQIAREPQGEPSGTASPHALTVAATCLRLSEVFYFSDIARALYYTATGFAKARRTREPRLLAEALSQLGFLLSTLALRGYAREFLVAARAWANNLPLVEQSWNRLLHGMSLGAFGDAAGYAAHMREAEALLEQSSEPMRLRQVWTLLGEALLALGDVQTADAYGQKVLRLAKELNDERGRGWGLYLRGWAAARAGDLAGGREFLAEAVAAAKRAGDSTFGTCAEGRGALASLLAGDLDTALRDARHAAEHFARRLLRHPSTATDGIFLAAAAAVYQRDGRLDRDVLWSVRKRAILGRELMFALRMSAPLFWAGLGAWHAARGRTRRGGAAIERGVKIAEQNGLRGELHDVHAVGALILRGEASAAHAEAAKRLRKEFAG